MLRLRSAMVLLSVVGLFVGLSAPASAATADKAGHVTRATYITGECYSAAPTGTEWVTSQAYHWKGTVHYVEFLYNEATHTWTAPIGSQEIRVNLSQNLTSGYVTMYGTYTLASPVVGSFVGVWTQGTSAYGPYGRAIGVSTDGPGAVATTRLGLDTAPYPLPFDGCAGFQVNEWVVTSR
jgi:hypothetical protein